MAREQGMDRLKDAHWKVIRFLRGYYLAQGKAPLGREIIKGLGISLLEIERLFPGGSRGLPNPRGCM